MEPYPPDKKSNLVLLNWSMPSTSFLVEIMLFLWGAPAHIWGPAFISFHGIVSHVRLNWNHEINYDLFNHIVRTRFTYTRMLTYVARALWEFTSKNKKGVNAFLFTSEWDERAIFNLMLFLLKFWATRKEPHS